MGMPARTKELNLSTTSRDTPQETEDMQDKEDTKAIEDTEDMVNTEDHKRWGNHGWDGQGLVWPGRR